VELKNFRLQETRRIDIGSCYCAVSAAFECSHLRVAKLLYYVISSGFVAKLKNFRLIETRRIDFTPFNKGSNVYIKCNIAHQLERKGPSRVRW